MKPFIWGESKAEYFFAQDWTTQISLKGLENFRFARRQYAEVSSLLSAAASDRFARRAAGSGLGIEAQRHAVET